METDPAARLLQVLSRLLVIITLKVGFTDG